MNTEIVRNSNDFSQVNRLEKIKRNIGLNLSMVAFALISSACGGEVGSTTNSVSAPQRGRDPEVCVLSYPNATVLNIVGNDNYRHVRVDHNNDGSFEYEGAAGSAPGLQYNEGPKGLDGQPVWEKPIQDRVCY